LIDLAVDGGTVVVTAENKFVDTYVAVVGYTVVETAAYAPGGRDVSVCWVGYRGRVVPYPLSLRSREPQLEDISGEYV
jgi:hypothetical protein